MLFFKTFAYAALAMLGASPIGHAAPVSNAANAPIIIGADGWRSDPPAPTGVINNAARNTAIAARGANAAAAAGHDVNVAARGKADLAGIGFDTLGQLAGIVMDLVEKAKEDRAAFVEGMLDGLIANFPNQNSFIYHRFSNFQWTVDDASKIYHEEEVSWQFNGNLGPREYYYVVVFDGHGTLNKNGNDGGWINWGYYRGSRDAEVVTFN